MSASVAHEAGQPEDAARMFAPIVARTSVHHEPAEPVAHDCVKLIFVRAGSAIVFSEFGQRPVKMARTW